MLSLDIARLDIFQISFPYFLLHVFHVFPLFSLLDIFQISFHTCPVHLHHKKVPCFTSLPHKGNQQHPIQNAINFLIQGASRLLADLNFAPSDLEW